MTGSVTASAATAPGAAADSGDARSRFAVNPQSATRAQLEMSRAALAKEAEMAQAGLSANAETLARELQSRALRRKVEKRACHV